ncbi:serine/threonine-protein kinase AFC1 isoform X4 [Capsicum annuum]|uniref:serine/threonine-protein kinase AFC1 isoform X4 n=1 Tax=Capsicum annuum TaxID=4072 RepID=UPI001FB0A213|nr:serine/threonine-protein kinase AFC1 isoform X4 [Capsicum annuum]
METQPLIEEFHGRNIDKRPRKRPRLTWDVGPLIPPIQPPIPPISKSCLVPVASGRWQVSVDLVEVLPTIYCGQEFGNGAGLNYAYSSIYYKGIPHNGSPPRRPDDKDGHYVFSIGENLTPRYRILSKMGEGTFGRVLECLDNETKELVAIKVVRSIHKYREAAMIEINVLQKLVRHDLGGKCCVQIRNWFDYRNHICIVFEKLGPSLYDFLRKNSYRSFPIDLVREFGRQLLESVAFMHDLRLIHTDLKPENILLVSSEYVKVPDYKGEALFQTHENLEHLAMMEKVLGPLPQHMAVRADRRAEKYFRRGARLDWPERATSSESMRAVWKLPRLPNLIMQHVDHSAGDLIDLLQGLLCYDPTKRLKAREALRHPFFSRDLRRCGYPM